MLTRWEILIWTDKKKLKTPHHILNSICLQLDSRQADSMFGWYLHWPVKTFTSKPLERPAFQIQQIWDNNIPFILRGPSGDACCLPVPFLTTLLPLCFYSVPIPGPFVKCILSLVIPSCCLLWFLNSRQTMPSIIVLDKHSSCLEYFLPVCLGYFSYCPQVYKMFFLFKRYFWKSILSETRKDWLVTFLSCGVFHWDGRWHQPQTAWLRAHLQHMLASVLSSGSKRKQNNTPATKINSGPSSKGNWAVGLR